jgi:hypothetical protein
LTMAYERGGYFASFFLVSPGKFCTKPFLSTMASVDGAGKKCSVCERYELRRGRRSNSGHGMMFLRVQGWGRAGMGQVEEHVVAVQVPCRIKRSW